VLAGMTCAITLLLWFCISLLGRRLIDRAVVKAGCCQAKMESPPKIEIEDS